MTKIILYMILLLLIENCQSYNLRGTRDGFQSNPKSNSNLKSIKQTHFKLRGMNENKVLSDPDYWNNGEVDWDVIPKIINQENYTALNTSVENEKIIVSLKDNCVLPVATASGFISTLYREKLQFDIGFSEIMNIGESPTMHMNLMDVFLFLYIISIDATYQKTKEVEQNSFYHQKSISNTINYIKYKKLGFPLFIIISSIFAKNVKNVL